MEDIQHNKGQERRIVMEELRLFIGNKWKPPIDNEHFTTHNPATDEEIAKVAKGGRQDAQLAMDAASKASKKFKKMSVWDRAKLLQNIARKIEEKREDLAYYLTLDQGKPFHTEAKNEVDSVIRTFYETGEQIKWLETSVIPVKDPNKLVYSTLKPKGVYAIITPWNYPYMMPTEFIAPALAAGNTMVWIPAPSTSLSAVKLMECFIEAGVPSGVINLITGMGDVVGDEVVVSKKTDAIAFCGSTSTGNIIANRGAGKPMLLELGGNGPTIVAEDAYIDYAAHSIAIASFTNAGQICSATERIFAHHSIQDELAEKITHYAKNINVGNPFDKNITMGPMNNKEVLEKNILHAEDSKDKGAKFLTGGGAIDDMSEGYYFPPTVVTNIKKDSYYYAEETFGPIAPIFAFENDEQLIQNISENRWGLTSSVFTNDINRALNLADEIPVGLLNINENSDYWEPHIPFGGASGKSSGIGRVGGKHAILEMCDLKTITINRL